MKYVVFIFILILFLIPTIFADIIEQTIINVKVHNGTIEVTNTDYTGNNLNESFEIVNGSVVFKEFSFPILFISNETVQIDLVDKYALCLTEKGTCETLKGQYDTAWTKCKVDLDECEETYEGENSTVCKKDLDNCNLRVKEKDLTIESKQGKITTLETEAEGKKYVKFAYAVGGLIAGYIICLYKEGKIGNKAKESAASDLNPGQAG